MYRKISAKEVEQLHRDGCRAEDWSRIFVKEGFTAGNIIDTEFRGDVRLGVFEGDITDPNGIDHRCGIYNSLIINCDIGDGCLISGITGYICNYDIDERVIILSCGTISCGARPVFGHGTVIKVLNEMGGREVILNDRLSAQTAYMWTMYRDRPELIRGLEEMASTGAAADPVKGRIGSGCVIVNCMYVFDVMVGAGCRMNGVSLLVNGKVLSRTDYPSYIGADVKAVDFIFAEGSRVDNGSQVRRCYVGQSCKIDQGFIITDSLVFANSDMTAGEAASVFAGPFTVSHHKSSLLIAGYFLFFNTGSGSNQSNHLFKSGPVHQGIHERGVKFGSNAYIMLPAREGVFNVVLGKHSSHHDTSDFPYSYLVEQDGKSFLLPGANLRSYGTHRDISKWPARDNRPALYRRDIINYEEFNPYVGEKLLRAMELCRRMLNREGVEIYNYNRLQIKSSMLRRGLQLYNTAFEATLGMILSKGRKNISEPCRRWVDCAGMILPYGELEKIIGRIARNEIGGFDEIDKSLLSVSSNYQDHAYSWALAILEERLGRKASAGDIEQAVLNGIGAGEALTAMRLEDGRRDHDVLMKTGYGIDAAGHEGPDADFAAVHGVNS